MNPHTHTKTDSAQITLNKKSSGNHRFTSNQSSKPPVHRTVLQGPSRKVAPLVSHKSAHIHKNTHTLTHSCFPTVAMSLDFHRRNTHIHTYSNTHAAHARKHTHTLTRSVRIRRHTQEASEPSDSFREQHLVIPHATFANPVTHTKTHTHSHTHAHICSLSLSLSLMLPLALSRTRV